MTMLESQCLAPLGVILYYAAPDSLPSACVSRLGSAAGEYGVDLVSYSRYLAWTMVLESFIYLPVLTRRGISLKKALASLFIVNLASHPLVVFAFPLLGMALSFTHAGVIVSSEVSAVLIEACCLYFYLRPLSPAACFAIALAANCFSWALGSTLISLLGFWA